MNSTPNQIIVCDIESTHKIISCAEILTIAMIKTDLDLNVIDRKFWRMRPHRWGSEHDAASSIHRITRGEAIQFPNKKETLREIYKYISSGKFIFAGHFNRDNFGMKTSFDYALLKQEFFDQSHDAYFKFGQVFDRKHILSTHTLAYECDKRGSIHVPLVVKQGNKHASKDFSLSSVCSVIGIPLDADKHHGAEYDAMKTLDVLKILSKKINIFEVIEKDWREYDESSDFTWKNG